MAAAEITTDWFPAIVVQQGWDPQFCLIVTLDYIDYHAGIKSFREFIDELLGDIQAAAPPPVLRVGVATPEDTTAARQEQQQVLGETQAMSVFFDRNLARQMLQSCKPCPMIGPIFDIGVPAQQFSMRVPDAEIIVAAQMLAGAVSNANEAGTIEMGWYGHISDGSTAVVAIIKGEEPTQFWVDALVLLPDNYCPQSPNPSLLPRTSLAEDFEFMYPDGALRTVRLQAIR